jgi:hypothetical protein
MSAKLTVNCVSMRCPPEFELMVISQPSSVRVTVRRMLPDTLPSTTVW